MGPGLPAVGADFRGLEGVWIGRYLPVGWSGIYPWVGEDLPASPLELLIYPRLFMPRGAGRRPRRFISLYTPDLKRRPSPVGERPI